VKYSGRVYHHLRIIHSPRTLCVSYSAELICSPRAAVDTRPEKLNSLSTPGPLEARK
jgi:hypothetical protein